MKVITENKEGGFTVVELPLESLATKDDIREMREELRILKAMVMRTPSVENAVIDIPDSVEEIATPHGFYKRANHSASTPQELNGISKQIYEGVLSGHNTRAKLNKLLAGHGKYTSIAPRLSDLCRMGFLVKTGKRKHFIYSKGLNGKIDFVKIKKKKFMKKPFGMTLKVYECVKNGVNDSSMIAKKLGCKITIAAASLLSLYRRGYIGRRESDKKFKAYEYISMVDLPVAPVSTPLVEEEKPVANPFENSVRGLAKNLQIQLSESAIAELAKDSNWAEILKVAKNEGNYYLSLDSIGYFRKKLFSPNAEAKVTITKRELRFACPRPMVDVLGEDASEKVLEFIKNREKSEINFKEWSAFLTGIDQGNLEASWAWFSANCRWLIREAMNSSAFVRLNPKEKVITWVD